MPCTLTDSYTHTHTDTHRCRGKRATHGQTADFVLFVGVDFSLMELNGKAERWTLWRALFYFVFICGGNCYFSIRLFSLTKWWNAATTRRNNENFECTHTQKIWQLEISFFKRIFFFVIFLEFYNHIIFFQKERVAPEPIGNRLWIYATVHLSNGEVSMTVHRLAEWQLYFTYFQKTPKHLATHTHAMWMNKHEMVGLSENF